MYLILKSQKGTQHIAIAKTTQTVKIAVDVLGFTFVVSPVEIAASIANNSMLVIAVNDDGSRLILLPS